MNTFINIFLIILVIINILLFMYIRTNMCNSKDIKDNTDMYAYSRPNKKLLSLLPPIYLINLEDRVDRLIQFKKEMVKIMYPEEKIFRIDAVKDENGHKGCLQSHVKALKIALQKNDPYVFIAEDDIYFLNDGLTTINCIVGEISASDWNVLLLDCRGIQESGSLTEEKLKRGKGFCGLRKRGCEGTTGYIIRKTYIPTLLSLWESSIGIDNWDNRIHTCDQSWKVLQDKTWKIVAPKLITARISFSSIENKLMKNYNITKNWERSPNNLPIELKSSQRKMSSMLNIFNNISKKCDFKYWAIGGTLLGIIRNKNWIDWDGDIDISMLKSDYFTFRDIIIKELPENLWLQDFISDKNYKEERVAKIKDLNSCYTEYSKNHKDSHNGLQIDIVLCDIDNDNENGILKNGFDNDFYTSQKTEDVFPLKLGKFGNLNIPIPNNSHKILTEKYGNYMKLPPLSKRYPKKGETSTYKTCDHHVNLYPHLYLKMKDK